MIDKKKDFLKVAKREKTFSTLAKKEGKEASKRAKTEAKAGLKESAKDSRRETKIDYGFAKFRKELAKKALKGLKKEKESLPKYR